MAQQREYEMTQAQLDVILHACKAVPVIYVSGGAAGPSPQETANRAWAKLGRELGFDFMTVRPVPGKGQAFFYAIPTKKGADHATVD